MILFKFHITGFVGNGESFWSNRPVDIKVFAENQKEAIRKAENTIGYHISLTGRKIFIEEMVGDNNAE